ncbi:quinone-dependent dihydroorotate dehydrogenase [Acidithiobacillus sp. HP-6]|uniref:quinone-dependent dihydroorotate dehydrogenase n=1 Tax=unclassified Acidithiobacillus TaxID=2614800 RepID=UPI00187A4136|nr:MULTISPECIES: quinone-dependent dihydroorotate dehydrogenase [unclassified Acidithiobacillus]MBE7561638.1 quinone-dependent dihydroorotate dehydrogenase [Acidithiobacillus sp. HP-6]MBE7568448.1 quinone-dependent dihydroorotate dehydrogenase [Acidithiobacillus sp. HP-2]
MIYPLLRPLLFGLEAEQAHQLSIAALETLGRMPRSLERVSEHFAVENPALQQSLWGLNFRNPVGLAAGYDKDARATAALPALGFGFVEIGTVTPRAQSGNPRPRVFRYPSSQAVINRMGFPGEGAAAVAERLRAIPHPHRVPIGINLGKNKDTPLEQATADYVSALEVLFPYGDYLTVNVSSPNTPGLRLLQGADALPELLAAVAAANQRLAAEHQRPALPLLLKIAPDLNPEDIGAMAQLGKGDQPLVDGFIATNTTIDRPAGHPEYVQAGGLSGTPLRSRANAVIAQLYRETAGKVPIVGVGGISCAADAYEKIRAGASLLQIYTGLVFRGPELLREILLELPDLCQKDGFAQISTARGTANNVEE